MEREETAVCRLCGLSTKSLTEIYGSENLSKDLPSKINTYLPITVHELDKISLCCCYNCTSLVLAWHELVLKSVEVNEKLKAVEESQKGAKECNQIKHEELEVEFAIAEDRPDPEPTRSLSAFCQEPVVVLTNEDVKNEVDTCAKEESIKQWLIQGDIKSDAEDENRNINSTDQDDEEAQNNGQKGETIRKELTDYSITVIESDEEIELEDVEKKLGKKDRKKITKLDRDMVNAAKVLVEDRMYYNCKICSKSLHSPYTYIWHMRIHTGERPYVCDLCGKQFRVSQGLVRHLRETHEGIKNFGCDLCGRMFATRRNVEEHRRIHTNERPYICDLCGKSFKQKASLFVHNRSHKDSFPYKCTYCNQGFRTKPPMLIHVTRHTGERPYPCELCGRRFRIKYELKRHKLIHSEEKPFACADCGLRFRQKRYLRNHNKVNHNRTTP